MFELKVDNDLLSLFPHVTVLAWVSDGTIHNLHEYMEIKAADIYPNNNIDLKDAIFSRKLGVVANDLEEFFSQIL